MRKWLYNIILILLVVIFCVSSWVVVSYYWEGKQQADEFDQLSQMVQQAQQNAATEPTLPPTVPETTEAETVPTETEPKEMLPGYAELYAKNSHTVGWLRIDGTKINYPVMQTPASPDYYLKRDFNRQESSRGCLYVREACDVFAPSDNVTIYGHMMADGSMFADLHDYVNPFYWDKNNIVCFDTLYECHEYRIFAVFKTTATLGQGFAYHQMEDAADQQEFDDFIAKCKELAFYDTGITPQYGDKIICLSTCEYSQDNGRLVVAAVRID